MPSGLFLILLLALASPYIAQAQYLPTWESLKTHPDPQWFDDAKFGIYCHWGPYAVPAFGNEWYSRNMYRPGTPENKHHLEKYGPLDKFGYKDFIPMFKAEKFNADEWAELFAQAGARFAGPVAEHADGFALWDSKLTRWNAVRMGPRRDVVGELEKAIRKRGLKFIATLHHQWLWAWYPTFNPAVDASNPEYAGLYGPPVREAAWNFSGSAMRHSPEFCRLWEDKIREVIDKYQPDLLWFDGRMWMIDEGNRRSFLAYYYNSARRWGRDVAVTYKDRDLEPGTAIVDIERGRMSKKTSFKWLNDDSIDWKSWCYIENPDYKSVNRLIDGLVDIVSKDGNLLLNIGPKPDGTIPEPVRERLLAMGAWLRMNGEAIYGTRPWETFGEGPTQISEGHFGERKIAEFTSDDIRFTTKPGALYAILLDWPANGSARIHSLPDSERLPFGKIKTIRMFGDNAAALTWKQDAQGLIVNLPAHRPCDHAYVLKITGS